MRALIGLACCLCSTLAAAAAPTAIEVPSATSKKITTALHERVPELRVDNVYVSPIAGLYEIVSGDEIFYSDAQGKYVVLGRIMDSTTRENLSEKSWSAHHSVDFGSLPLSLAITTVRGDGSRKIAVFADPMCPFCKDLEQQLQNINNVTIYTFLYPLESIHTGATALATRIWCAKDPSAAWSQWMLQKVEPPAETCNTTPIETLQTLGAKLRIDSTPTLFFADGRRARGSIQQASLEKTLSDIR